MSKMLYSINWTKGIPSVEDVSKELGIDKTDIDPEFGIIEIDPQEHLYSIMVEESAISSRLQNESDESPANLQGPFSNPRIEPFGLEE